MQRASCHLICRSYSHNRSTHSRHHTCSTHIYSLSQSYRATATQRAKCRLSCVCLKRWYMCVSVLSIAACCSVLQHFAACFSVLQRAAACCSLLQPVAGVHIYTPRARCRLSFVGSTQWYVYNSECLLQRVATCCSVLQVHVITRQERDAVWAACVRSGYMSDCLSIYLYVCLLCSLLQWVTVWYNLLQRVAACCSMLQHVAACCEECVFLHQERDAFWAVCARSGDMFVCLCLSVCCSEMQRVSSFCRCVRINRKSKTPFELRVISVSISLSLCLHPPPSLSLSPSFSFSFSLPFAFCFLIYVSISPSVPLSVLTHHSEFEERGLSK